MSESAVERQAEFDAAYAELERARPKPYGGRLEYRTYNAYCREMDAWTAEYNRLLEADGKDACATGKERK